MQDWTIRAVVAAAGFDEHRQRMDHVLKAFDLVSSSWTWPYASRSGFVAPYTEQITDLVDGKPEIACSRHPTKAVLFEAMVIDVVNFCNSRIEAADQRKPELR
ncbi:hypothetical protein [Afipia felis]